MDEEKKTEAPTAPEPNFSEKVAEAKDKGRRRAFKKAEASKAYKSPFSDREMEIGRRMLGILMNEGYKALEEYEALQITDQMSKAFDLPPPAWMGPIKPDGSPVVPMSFGEAMAYKKGFNFGLQVFRMGRQQLIRAVLDQQAFEAKRKEQEQS